MSEDKTEWPTEDKLADLRSEGITAYSSVVTRCAIVFALTLFFYLKRADWMLLWQQVSSFLHASGGDKIRVALYFDRVLSYSAQVVSAPLVSIPAIITPGLVSFYALRTSLERFDLNAVPDSRSMFFQIGEIGHQLLSWIIFPMILVIVVTFALGVLQSKFLFRLANIRLDFSKLNPFKPIHLPGLLGKILGTLVIGVVVLFLAALFTRSFLPFILVLLNRRADFLISWPGEFAQRLFPLVIAGSGLSLIVFWIVSVIRFRMAHRMTRQEVLSSEREA